MAAEKVYAKGIRFFKKHQSAPDFVLGSLVITPNELVKWLKENQTYQSKYKDETQLRLQLLKGKEDGDMNIVVDTYKPKEKEQAASVGIASDSSDLPF